MKEKRSLFKVFKLGNSFYKKLNFKNKTIIVKMVV
jgi:hypothetical protein